MKSVEIAEAEVELMALQRSNMLVIRPISTVDREAWLTLWREYLAFYHTWVSDEVTEATWRRLVAGDRNQHGLIAIQNSHDAIGFANYLFHRSTWAIHDYCYLEDLFVARMARGHGVGRRLVERVFEEADKQKASRVYWLTNIENTEARKLYDSLGTVTPFLKYER